MDNKTLREMAEAIDAVQRAASGDSNDDEIDALQQALELAMTRWPELEYKPGSGPYA